MLGLCSIDEFTLSLAYIKLRMRMKDIVYINNQTLKQNRLIEDQQRIAVWNLQPWEVMRQSPHSKERTLLKWGKGSWEGLSKQRVQGRN